MMAKRIVTVHMRKKGSIRFPDRTVDYATFAEAIEHWWKLAPDGRAHGVLVTEEQKIFSPGEIEEIEFKPA
jgi:hypothetical protein